MGLITIACRFISALTAFTQYGNSLTYKNASSSTPLFSASSMPTLAIDGKPFDETQRADKTCFMASNRSDNDAFYWFEVDLGFSCSLLNVKIAQPVRSDREFIELLCKIKY